MSECFVIIERFALSVVLRKTLLSPFREEFPFQVEQVTRGGIELHFVVFLHILELVKVEAGAHRWKSYCLLLHLVSVSDFVAVSDLKAISDLSFL